MLNRRMDEADILLGSYTKKDGTFDNKAAAIAGQQGFVDPQTLLVANMLSQRAAQAKAGAQSMQPTVAQQVFSPENPNAAGNNPQWAAPSQPPQQMPPQGMAMGGLASLQFDADYADGGIVGYAAGDEVNALENEIQIIKRDNPGMDDASARNLAQQILNSKKQAKEHPEPKGFLETVGDRSLGEQWEQFKKDLIPVRDAVYDIAGSPVDAVTRPVQYIGDKTGLWDYDAEGAVGGSQSWKDMSSMLDGKGRAERGRIPFSPYPEEVVSPQPTPLMGNGAEEGAGFGLESLTPHPANIAAAKARAEGTAPTTAGAPNTAAAAPRKEDSLQDYLAMYNDNGVDKDAQKAALQSEKKDYMLGRGLTGVGARMMASQRPSTGNVFGDIAGGLGEGLTGETAGFDKFIEAEKGRQLDDSKRQDTRITSAISAVEKGKDRTFARENMENSRQTQLDVADKYRQNLDTAYLEALKNGDTEMIAKIKEAYQAKTSSSTGFKEQQAFAREVNLFNKAFEKAYGPDTMQGRSMSSEDKEKLRSEGLKKHLASVNMSGVSTDSVVSTDSGGASRPSIYQ